MNFRTNGQKNHNAKWENFTFAIEKLTQMVLKTE